MESAVAEILALQKDISRRLDSLERAVYSRHDTTDQHLDELKERIEEMHNVLTSNGFIHDGSGSEAEESIGLHHDHDHDHEIEIDSSSSSSSSESESGERARVPPGKKRAPISLIADEAQVVDSDSDDSDDSSAPKPKPIPKRRKQDEVVTSDSDSDSSDSGADVPTESADKITITRFRREEVRDKPGCFTYLVTIDDNELDISEACAEPKYAVAVTDFLEETSGHCTWSEGAVTLVQQRMQAARRGKNGEVYETTSRRLHFKDGGDVYCFRHEMHHPSALFASEDDESCVVSDS